MTTLPHCPEPSTSTPRRAACQRLNIVIGTPELAAWQPVAGVTWIQTRSPQFARKLSQRQDSRLVMRGVAGGYLRTFEFPHRLNWAQRLIARYIRNGEATNAAKTDAVCPATAFDCNESIRTAEDRQ